MTKIRDKLFGKIQQSNYGRYEYEVEGALPKDAYVRPVQAVLIIKKEYSPMITETFDSYEVKYRIFEIRLDPEVFKEEDFF